MSFLYMYFDHSFSYKKRGGGLMFFLGGEEPENRFEYRKPCDKPWDKSVSTEAYIRHKMRIAWLEHRTTKYNSQMVISLGREITCAHEPD